MLFKNELALCVLPKRKHIQPVKKILLFLGKFHCKLINKSNSVFFSLEGNILQVFIGDREQGS